MTRTSTGLLLLAVTLLPLVVQAQPQVDNDVARQQAQQAALWSWRNLQREMAPQELSVPARAIAAYQKFYEESGHLSLEVSVGVTSRIARLWARELKNPNKAGEIYAWALEQWGETPYKERLQREAEAIRALGQAPQSEGEVAKVEAGVAPVSVAPVGVAPFGATLAPVRVGVLGAKPVGTKPVGVAAVGGAFVVPELMVPLVKSKSPFELSPFAGVDVPSTGAANLSAVGGGAVGLRVALEEMHAGRLSAQDAGKRGALTVDGAVRLLEQTGEWGNVDGRKNEPLRRDLGLFVVQQAPHLLQEPDRLPMPVRLWIADALSGERDLRGVPLFESVLRELKARGAISTEREAGAVFLASERLAWLYRDTDQHEKEIQTWLELPQLLKGTPLRERTNWMLPDALLGAARAYGALGQQEKAKELYAQVSQSGNSWFAGLSRYDIAHSQIQAGDNIGGQNVLREALQSASGPVQIGLYSLLSASYLKSGQTQMASEAASKTIELFAQYREANALKEGVGLEYQLERAVKVRDLAQKGMTPADAQEVDNLLR